MSWYFRALAVDYDGTLTRQARPDAPSLAAIRDVRAAGTRVLLVTGRILSELRGDFPEVDDHFDAIVAENGAVLAAGGFARSLTAPVAPELEEGLARLGVPVRHGRVILATEASADRLVLDEIARYGFEYQIVRNRSALMVVPNGISKGVGLSAALAEFDLSPHNAVGIGDAENDHSLLEVCEVGVAPANAVPSLRARADLVLREEDGAGVTSFLTGPWERGLDDVIPARRRVRLGTCADGTPAVVPSARTDIGIYGESGQGKSYLAGLLAERLVGEGYALCVLDLEGDHAGLSALHDVIGLGGRDALPSPAQVAEIVRSTFGSVIVDLSSRPDDEKRDYAIRALEVLRRTREETGRPHWILVEEAHLPLGAGSPGCGTLADGPSGMIIVSYRPELLCRHVTAHTEIRIVAHADGSASLADDAGERWFAPGPRSSRHSRHWRKYVEGTLPHDRRFWFRDAHHLTGRSAGNLREFVWELTRAPNAVLLHHARGGDFTRWIADLSRDRALVSRVRALEQRAAAEPAAADAVRRELVAAVERRYRG